MSFEPMDINNKKRPGGRNVVMLYGFAGMELEMLAGTVLTSGIDEWLYVDEVRSGAIIEEMIEHLADNQGVTIKAEKDQVILFHGTSQYELQQYINKAMGFLKERPLVAMVTPMSKKWQFKSLINELKEERKELEKLN